MAAKSIDSLARGALRHLNDCHKSQTNLQKTCKAQLDILADISDPEPAADDQLSKLQGELAYLENRVCESQDFLDQCLNEKPAPPASADRILKVFLTNTMKAIQNTCLAAADESGPLVHLSKLRDIEESIEKVIDSLCDSNMFYETDPEFEAREQASREHAARFAEFMDAQSTDPTGNA
jgi:hypothetical protein